MYPQQQPTYEELMINHTKMTSQVNTLRQAMLQNPHNIQMQNDYTTQINALTQDINYIVSLMQQMQNQQPQQMPQQYNNNIQQPSYMPQPQQQVTQQPVFRGGGFGTPNQTMNNNPTQEAPYQGANDRYNRRNTAPAQQAAAVDYTIPVHEPVHVVELKPLIGNEFVPLIAEGVTVEQVNMGEYFKYSYKGRDMCKIDPSEILVKKYDDEEEVAFIPFANKGAISSDIAIFLKATSLESEKKIVCVDMIECRDVLIEKDSKLSHHKLLENVNTLSDLRGKLINEINGCSHSRVMEREFLLNLNISTTIAINNFLNNVAGTSITIDSFVEDYKDLEEHIQTLTIEEQKNLGGALTEYFKSIQYNQEMIDYCSGDEVTYSSEKFTTTCVANMEAVVYIDKSIDCLNVDQFDKETLMVTENSFTSFYEILMSCKDALNSKQTNHMKLVHDDRVYSVFYNAVTKYFTIQK